MMSHFPPRAAERARIAALLALTLLPLAPLAAQGPPPNTARPKPIAKSGAVPREAAVEAKLASAFKAPEGYSVTLFAGPPVAMYPTCVGESPDGAVFVCVDPNLSLSTLKGVGRVMRLVDSDDDGRADTYTTFAEMDSPRGVASDGRTVYVMHPPNLTAYRDTNGDGIADTSKVLVTGLGFDLDFRGADHTTNNIQLGPDGWLYVAVGDYGFMKAVGADGKQLQQRGGSVVRVRPDGTNLELVTVGTRNIYDVAIDPFARLYARDNTNDGDGWNTRLHYLAPGAIMGYPSLYQNFATEHFPTMHDYGGGSGVGALWIQDPAWPAGMNDGLYTGDWTTQRIYRHTLTPKGAIYDADAGGLRFRAAAGRSHARRQLQPVRCEPRRRTVHLQHGHGGLRRAHAAEQCGCRARAERLPRHRRRAPPSARVGQLRAPRARAAGARAPR